jgi:hypothetical protein
MVDGRYSYPLLLAHELGHAYASLGGDPMNSSMSNASSVWAENTLRLTYGIFPLRRAH